MNRRRTQRVRRLIFIFLSLLVMGHVRTLLLLLLVGAQVQIESKG